MASLHDTFFTDLVLGPNGAWVKGLKGHAAIEPVMDPEMLRETNALYSICTASGNRERREFTVNHKDVIYRASRLLATSGQHFVLRRSQIPIRYLAMLGLAKPLVELLLSPAIKNGLVIVSGATGQGKTTTVSALMKARLETYGGLALTVEDPTECPLTGEYRDGMGVCLQTELEAYDPPVYAQALKDMMRQAPDIIMIGEIRDADAARQAIQAGLNGHLVLTTMHAGSVIETIERLAAMVRQATDDTANYLVAEGLQFVLHQTLRTTVDKQEPRLRTEHLWMGDAPSSPPRAKVRMGQIPQLSSDIQLQLNRMLMNGH